MKPYMRASLIISIFGLCLVLGLLAHQTLTAPEKNTANRQMTDIGRAFELVDDTGQRVTQDIFKGRYTLLYFGFSFCPDVCPTSLQIMSVALDLVEADKNADKRAAQINPVFVTVDPERDTPDALQQYVSHFHPRLRGWTGTPAQIEAAMRAFKVYRARVEDATNPDGYTIDHSSIFYLMGPDGGFIAHFDHAITPEKLAAALQRLSAN